jgi:hypothetical protein
MKEHFAKRDAALAHANEMGYRITHKLRQLTHSIEPGKRVKSHRVPKHIRRAAVDLSYKVGITFAAYAYGYKEKTVATWRRRFLRPRS